MNPTSFHPRVVLAENVNQAFFDGLSLLRQEGTLVETRNGPAYQLPGMLITSYRKPQQRMLLVPGREANPFFHIFESLWMLSGSEDIAFPVRYVASMANYSDDGKTFNGAYGFRWRNAFGVDQIEEVIRTLTKDPNSRRTVIQMWDTQRDLVKAAAGSKDVCCNMLVKFSIVQKRLLMRVSCRSNDMVLGGYGANAVHFSFLQEYVCDRLKQNGVEVEMGNYDQISMDAHMYTAGLYGQKQWDAIQAALDWDFEQKDVYCSAYQAYGSTSLCTLSPYLADLTLESGAVESLSESAREQMGFDIDAFDSEVQYFVGASLEDAMSRTYTAPYLKLVAKPMMVAYTHYKEKDLDSALMTLKQMRADLSETYDMWADQRLDVEVACSEWIERRIAIRDAKENQHGQ